MSQPGFFTQSHGGKKRKRESVEDINARLNGIIFSAMDAIVSVDAEQRILLFNPAAEKMFGLSAAEVLGQNISRFIPPRFREAHSRHVERFGQSGTSMRGMGALGTISGLRANGEEFPIEASISQVEIAGEKLFTVILRDVSERKRSEKAVHASEARKAAILESALDCIINIDREGKVLEVNAAAERVLGYKPEEMLGREMAELIIPARLREAHRHGLARFLATGEGPVLGKRIEMTALRRDGTEFAVELAISCFRLNGSPCFTGTLRDITDRKRAETDLKEAVEQLGRTRDELEQRVQERTATLRQTIGDLEAFSYSLSHDMRAPLRAIGNLTRIFLEDFGANTAPDGIELLKRVVGAAQHMDRLLLDLLIFSRVSLQPVEFQPVEPESLLRELIGERPELQPPQAEIRILSPLLPVTAHPAALRQVLENLLSNAVKFVAPGVVPQLRIWTEARPNPDSPSINPERSIIRQTVRLWVEDNGIGVPVKAQQKIFEIFQRLHKTSEYEGSGIGLAIVRKAVERMGGVAGLESEPGKGSRFWIELTKASPAPETKNKKLLELIKD